MRKRQLNVGERVWDCDNHQWVNILSFGNGETTLEDKDGETMVVVDNHDFDETYTIRAAALYKVAGKFVLNRDGEEHIICYEHFESIDYPYYCPDYDENFYTSELDAK